MNLNLVNRFKNFKICIKNFKSSVYYFEEWLIYNQMVN